MGKIPNPSSDRAAWEKIFKALVDMTKTQQRQLESLAKERKFLEKRIKLQYDRWVSDVQLLEDQMSQMKREFTVQEMTRLVEAAKSDLILGLKQREAFVCKHKLEDIDEEREDLKVLFEELCRGLSEPKRTTRSNKGEEQQHIALESEVRRLKIENKKLKSSNNSDVSALLSERNFVWNQYKEMETNLNDQIRSANAEVEHANEKINKLLTSLEQLQSSNIEKDNTIVALKSEMAKLQFDSVKKIEEVSRLSRELDLLRKSRNDSVTPIRRCSTEPRHSRMKGKTGSVDGITVTVRKDSVTPLHRRTMESRHSRGEGKKSGLDGMTVTVRKDVPQSHNLEKGCKTLKRKAAGPASTPKTLKLFSSDFKVPKLKNPSPW